ncbi:MAG TPA: ABC transporter ATP-binding protein [Nocardioidaceae bacterium]|nr:ABC transporter ATP-binding protein [Nocardioidaceae bacterium]
MSPLVVQGLAKSFGGVIAIDDVSFALHDGELLGLIGPNGAGKSTVLGVLSGAMAPDRGSVTVHGEAVVGLSAHDIARRGLRRCYQLPRTLLPLSVLENMLVGAHTRHHTTLRAAVLHPRSTRATDHVTAVEAMEFLDKFGMRHLAGQPARTLSGGQRKLLSIGQALMGHPRILVLDEPVAGVHPSFVEDIAGLLLDARANGVSVLVVEHNLRFLEEIADRVVVMAAGKVLAEGRLSDVRERDDVAEAYLGRREPRQPTDSRTTDTTGQSQQMTGERS